MLIEKLYIFILTGYGLVILFQVWRLRREFKGKRSPMSAAQRRFLVNASLLMLGLPLLLSALVFHLNIFDYKAPVPHAQAAEITFRDFRAVKLPQVQLDGQDEFAYIVTTIDWSWQEDGVQVNAFFHPARSYVFNDRLADGELLRHELYHFHISELHARKIRKALTLANGRPDGGDIDQIVAGFRAQERRMQFRYDEESYHSYVLGEQLRWEGEVDSLLHIYDAYKSTQVNF